MTVVAPVIYRRDYCNYVSLIGINYDIIKMYEFALAGPRVCHTDAGKRLSPVAFIG